MSRLDCYRVTATCPTHDLVGEGQILETPDVSRYPVEGRRLRSGILRIYLPAQESWVGYMLPLSVAPPCPHCGADLTFEEEVYATFDTEATAT